MSDAPLVWWTVGCSPPTRSASTPATARSCTARGSSRPFAATGALPSPWPLTSGGCAWASGPSSSRSGSTRGPSAGPWPTSSARPALDRGDASVRITVTGGLDGGGPRAPRAGPPSLGLIARGVPRSRGPAAVRAGCVHGASYLRSLPGLKTTGYVPSLLAQRAARERGLEEAILVASDGEVLEASTANVFVRRDDVLLTPPRNRPILAGVTRGDRSRPRPGAGARRPGAPARRVRPGGRGGDPADGLRPRGGLRRVPRRAPIGRGRPGSWCRALFRTTAQGARRFPDPGAPRSRPCAIPGAPGQCPHDRTDRDGPSDGFPRCGRATPAT